MKVVLGIRGPAHDAEKVLYRCDQGFKLGSGTESEDEVEKLVTAKLKDEYFGVVETLELLTPRA